MNEKNFVLVKKIAVVSFLSTALIITSGCASRRHEELKAQVAKVAYNGMPVQKALNNLSVQTYQCREGSIFVPKRKNFYECIRHNSHFWPGYECTNRVQFEPDINKNVINLQVDYPACTEETRW